MNPKNHSKKMGCEKGGLEGSLEGRALTPSISSCQRPKLQNKIAIKPSKRPSNTDRFSAPLLPGQRQCWSILHLPTKKDSSAVNSFECCSYTASCKVNRRGSSWGGGGGCRAVPFTGFRLLEVKNQQSF